MEGKFQKFSFADSGNLDTWFIFQNVDGDNEFISLVFVFTSEVIATEGFCRWQQKINKLNKINKKSLIRKWYWLGFWATIHEIWGVRYWHSPELVSIYQVSVTPIVVILLMVIWNPVTCTIFGKSSTRSFRCTYQLWLNNNNTKRSQFLAFK